MKYTLIRIKIPKNTCLKYKFSTNKANLRNRGEENPLSMSFQNGGDHDFATGS